MGRFVLLLILALAFLAGLRARVDGVALSQVAGSGEKPLCQPPLLIRLVRPEYPPLAWQAGVTGDVTVELLIRSDGTVGSAEVVGGHARIPQEPPLYRDSSLPSETPIYPYIAAGCVGQRPTTAVYVSSLQVGDVLQGHLHIHNLPGEIRPMLLHQQRGSLRGAASGCYSACLGTSGRISPERYGDLRQGQAAVYVPGSVPEYHEIYPGTFEISLRKMPLPMEMRAPDHYP